MTLLFLVDVLDNVRFYLFTNLHVQIDTHHQWQVWILGVFHYPFLVQMNLYKLFMLLFTNRGSRVVALHRLTVKMPHIIFPGECFFFFPIMSNSSVIVCEVNIDSLVHGKLLLVY